MKVQIPSIPDWNLFAWRVFKISLWHFSVLAGWKATQLHPAPLQPFWMSLSQFLRHSRRPHILNAMSQASPLMLMRQGGGRLTALPAHAGFLCLWPLWHTLCFVQGGISFLALISLVLQVHPAGMWLQQHSSLLPHGALVTLTPPLFSIPLTCFLSWDLDYKIKAMSFPSQC